jgi:polysaccharide export outer membrane protein
VKLIHILTIFIILFTGCTSRKHELFYKNTEITPYSQTFNGEYKYIIKPHDRLSIIFFEYPELGTKNKDVSETDVGTEVQDDGTIFMPLIGKVRVAGMFKEMVENMLYERYSSYLEQPALRVDILNQKVYVLGEVKNPGSIDILKYKTLSPLQAIIEKGGLTNFARRDMIKVVRGTRDNYQIIDLDLTDMYSLRSYNINLLPDDIVYVAHNSVKDFNLPLNGAESSLGLINTIFSTLTLQQALKQR